MYAFFYAKFMDTKAGDTESRTGTVNKLTVTTLIFLKGLHKLNNIDRQHSHLPLLVILCHTEVSDSQQLISLQSTTFSYHDTLTLPLKDSEESGTASKNQKEWWRCNREVSRVGVCVNGLYGSSGFKPMCSQHLLKA